MRRNVQIVAMHHDVADRRHGHVVLQRLPPRSIVERHIHPQLRRRIQQPLGLRVFLHRVHVSSLRNSRHDLRPALSAIVRAEDVRLHIGEPMPVHRRIRRSCVKVSRFDLRYLAPRCHRRWSHVAPRLAVIARHVDQPIIRAHPHQLRIQRRRSNRVDDAKPIRHLLIDILRSHHIQATRHLRMKSRQIRADRRPGLAAIP